jgi:hypothetical protein
MKHLSEEHKRKIGLSNKIVLRGRTLSEETKKRISNAVIGEKNHMFGKKHSEETRKKISISSIGRTGYWLGKKRPSFSDEWKKKIGIASKENLKGRIPPHTKTKEFAEKISKAFSGEKHPNWQGGKSFEPYGIEFNKNLKKQIKMRDSFCKECSENNKRKLVVHHIDYNKKNNNSNNLITLCRSCHGKTNFNRENWIKYYKNK